MKKKRTVAVILIVVLLTLSVTSLVSCSIRFSNKMLRDKMVKYYSTDDNYRVLQGEVVIPYVEETAEYSRGATVVKILTPDHGVLVSATGEQAFFIHASHQLDLNQGDIITFVSAPIHLYSGHIMPIVAIKNGDAELLSFVEGKANLLKWANQFGK